jgi:DNA-directed RNA polymerase specialized sigma24 family protein
LSDEEDLSPKGRSTIQDRISAFEMLDRMGEATQVQKTVRLSLVGFNRHEIAAMLQISPNQVSVNLYSAKSKVKKPAAKKPT